MKGLNEALLSSLSSVGGGGGGAGAGEKTFQELFSSFSRRSVDGSAVEVSAADREKRASVQDTESSGEEEREVTNDDLERMCTILIGNPAGSFTDVNHYDIENGMLRVYFTPRQPGEYSVKFFERKPDDRYSDDHTLLRTVPLIVQHLIPECFAAVPVKCINNKLIFPQEDHGDKWATDEYILRVITPNGWIQQGRVLLMEGENVKIDFEPEEGAGDYLAEIFDQMENLVAVFPVSIEEDFIH